MIIIRRGQKNEVFFMDNLLWPSKGDCPCGLEVGYFSAHDTSYTTIRNLNDGFWSYAKEGFSGVGDFCYLYNPKYNAHARMTFCGLQTIQRKPK